MKKILVSACLLGEPCRYDGKSKPCEAVIRLKEKYELIPVCPEQLGGLSTPRAPSERNADGEFINTDGENVTANYEKGANIALQIAKENGCTLAILKEKSPSCGVHNVYDGTFSGTLVNKMGITAFRLTANGIRVLSEDDCKEL